MKIVVGLGNPGSRYLRTRHNLGFLAVEEFCRKEGFAWTGRECHSRTARGRVGGEEVLVAEPQTYMNCSGDAVACLLQQEHASLSDLLVVCDDAALDLGSIRLRASGSDGGHRGLRSIGEALGTHEFARLRLGIRTDASLIADLAGHVLSAFDPAEGPRLEQQVSSAAECMKLALERGIRIAMNRFNRRQPRDPQPAD